MCKNRKHPRPTPDLIASPKRSSKMNEKPETSSPTFPLPSFTSFVSPHPDLAVGDRVVDLFRPDEILTVKGYIPSHGVLLLFSDSGTPMICPAKWYERLSRRS